MAREAALRNHRLAALDEFLSMVTKRREVFREAPEKVNDSYLLGLYLDETAKGRVAMTLISAELREEVGGYLTAEIAYLLAQAKGLDSVDQKARELKAKAEALGKRIEREIFLYR